MIADLSGENRPCTVARFPGASTLDFRCTFHSSCNTYSQLSNRRYAIADIKTSDHRPVYATFNLEVHIVDDSKKQKIADELSRTLGGKTARNGAGVERRVEAKRSPPGVPDRTKKSVPETNLISLDEKSSPSKGKLTVRKLFSSLTS